YDGQSRATRLKPSRMSLRVCSLARVACACVIDSCKIVHALSQCSLDETGTAVGGGVLDGTAVNAGVGVAIAAAASSAISSILLRAGVDSAASGAIVGTA